MAKDAKRAFKASTKHASARHATERKISGHLGRLSGEMMKNESVELVQTRQKTPNQRQGSGNVMGNVEAEHYLKKNFLYVVANTHASKGAMIARKSMQKKLIRRRNNATAKL